MLAISCTQSQPESAIAYTSIGSQKPDPIPTLRDVATAKSVAVKGVLRRRANRFRRSPQCDRNRTLAPTEKSAHLGLGQAVAVQRDHSTDLGFFDEGRFSAASTPGAPQTFAVHPAEMFVLPAPLTAWNG